MRSSIHDDPGARRGRSLSGGVPGRRDILKMDASVNGNFPAAGRAGAAAACGLSTVLFDGMSPRSFLASCGDLTLRRR
jgi:hypothetical protein